MITLDISSPIHTYFRQNGRCCPYLPSSNDRFSMCDTMFTPGVDYVYVPYSRLEGDQGELRGVAESATTILKLLSASNPKCSEAVSKALCIHWYLPCGLNGSLHVPQFLCPDTCHYLTDVVCRTLWPRVVRDLNMIHLEIDLPDCSNTSMVISSLDLSEDCCSTGGVMMHPLAASTDPLILIGSVVGGGVALLVTMTFVLIIILYLGRNKMKRRRLDMSIRYMCCNSCCIRFNRIIKLED